MTATLRELWDAGEDTLGGWCVIPSGFGAELMGRCGFDWVCVDTQHGLIGYDQLAAMLQGLSITRTPALVRVAWNQPDHIMNEFEQGRSKARTPCGDSTYA